MFSRTLVAGGARCDTVPMSERSRALDAAHRAAAEFLASLPDRPVWPRASLEEMAAVFGGPLPEDGEDAAALVSRMAADADPGLVAIPGGRFFGFVIGGTLPAALAADWLVSAWDQNAGSSTMTPAAVAIEQAAGAWILDLLGLPATAAVGFVTGAQMSNFVCIAAARRTVLERLGWDFDRGGTHGAPHVRLVVGEHRHGSIDRAARFLGLGSDDLITVATDREGRMLPDALRAALDVVEPAHAVVCLQAGEVHTGAFDPFRALIPIVQDHGSWTHVDGAFGLWAAASADLRHLTDGAQLADSWTTDAHKTLNAPYDCGMAIVRRPDDAIGMFRTGGDYLMYAGSDPWDVGPELSRRARGVPVWAALRSLGRRGVEELVDRLHANAVRMAAGLRRIAGVHVVNRVDYTQVMFRLDDDARTVELGRLILAEGTAAVTPAVWDGRAVLRCSMSSWVTDEDDIDRTLAAFDTLIGGRRSPGTVGGSGTPR